MKLFGLLSSLAAVSAAFAVPTVDNVEIVQGADRVVRISYDLHDGPAIITFDATTNGVSLGDRAFDRSWGDVNVLVTNETGRFTIKWLPNEDILDDLIAVGGVWADVRAWSPDAPPDYIVFDMECKKTINYYATVGRLPGGIGSDTYRKEKLAMRKIPAAGVRWQMGAPSWQTGIVATNETQRWVTLSEDYYMAVFELTHGQYLRFRRARSSNVSYPEGSDAQCNTNDVTDLDLFPVSNIKRGDWRGYSSDNAGYTWPSDGHAVQSGVYLAHLREQTGFEFDFPTQAQWEYACRAGQSAALYNGKELHATSGNDSSLTNIAWYSSHRYNDANKKAPVGLLEPNAWGLYDMLGNVWEFVLDRQNGPRPATAVTDPTGPSTGTLFRQVGCGYWQESGSVRCAFSRGLVESSAGTDYGFRLCCPVNKTWKFAVTPAE